MEHVDKEDLEALKNKNFDEDDFKRVGHPEKFFVSTRDFPELIKEKSGSKVMLIIKGEICGVDKEYGDNVMIPLDIYEAALVHGKISSKDKTKVSSAFREVKENEPKIVSHTREKYGSQKAKEQMMAIALSKARKMGVKIKNY